jgi:hypothetical protein
LSFNPNALTSTLFSQFWHIFGTRGDLYLAGGVDLVTVEEILGHSSIEMTMRYAHPTPENMRRAVEKLGLIFSSTPHKGDSIEIKTPFVFLKQYN